MTFGLGVDLGTTYTAAATSRGDAVDMVTLGDRSAAIPSVVVVRDDGTSLVGDAAHRRAAAEPARVAREVKRRLGDPTPLILGGEPHSAADILSRLLGAVVDTVSEREGSRPDGIVLTHPANWGPYKRELFDSVPRLAELSAVSMITEPEAAAAHYASTARVAEGSVVAVYDLGGGTFDATVLRQLDGGFEFLGPAEGIEGLGGIDFDEAVFAHVDRSVDDALSELDLDDAQAAASLIRVRQDCVLAKEALSVDTETSVPVMLPGLHTEVRLTRAEFEEMIRGPIESTVSALRRALTAAEISPDDLSNVLLVGGSSRIPIVSQMLSAELGRPTSVDTHPKHAVALGAALMAERRRAAARPAGRAGPSLGRSATRPPGPAAEPGQDTPSAPPSTPAGGVRTSGRGPGIPAAAGGVAGLAGGAAAYAGRGAPPRTSGHAGPNSGLPPVVGPASGGIPGMRAPAGSPPHPPWGSFGALHPSGQAGPVQGGPTRSTGPEEPAALSAASSAPPALGNSKAASGPGYAKRRRRIRVAVICAAVALVLALGGVATAAALTDKTGHSTVAPPSPAAATPAVTTTPPPDTESETPPAPAAVQPGDTPATHASPHSPVHEHPTATTTAPTTSKPSSSGGGAGTGPGTGSGGGNNGAGPGTNGS